MSNVFLTKKAEKEIQKISSIDRKKVLSKLDQLVFPFPKNLDIKHMVGVDGFYRLRVGKIRIIFEIDPKTEEIWIRRVGYRSGVYGRM